MVIDEGIIEYETRVIDATNPLADLAPSSATLKFKKDKFFMEMSVMGMFYTIFICDIPAKELKQAVKFMDIKQTCTEKIEDIESENAAYKLNIKETNDTKMIAGYKCHKVLVSLVDDPTVSFEAYYTKEMEMENVNQLSPYSSIKGMLMQYRLKKMGLEMEFIAKSVKKVEIEDKTFIVPASFKTVTPQEMKKFFEDLK